MTRDAEGRYYREVQWDRFADKVAKHVKDYAIRQYGDFPDDKLTSYTFEDCIKQLEKYVDRNLRENNMRGRLEMKRDMLKIAHYACVALSKLNEEDNA